MLNKLLFSTLGAGAVCKACCGVQDLVHDWSILGCDGSARVDCDLHFGDGGTENCVTFGTS